MKTVLVCGGRDGPGHKHWAQTEAAMAKHCEDADHIIHGGCRGYDYFAARWAEENKKRVTAYPANWAEDGPSAGPIRNRIMIEKGKPDLVVAFPGGKGTADMVRRAKKNGVPVIEVSFDEALEPA